MPHKVKFPRARRNHDLMRSRQNELTETQQKDAKVVQTMLLGAAAAQILWHFAIQPWWEQRRRRGSSDASSISI